MPAYALFTTARVLDQDAVLAAIKVALTDPAAVLLWAGGNQWRGKKPTDWSDADLAAAQAVLDTVAASTPQLVAQHEIDRIPIATKALALILLDEINVLRTEVNTLRAAATPPITPPLPLRTVNQLITGWRNKAGGL